MKMLFMMLTTDDAVNSMIIYFFTVSYS